MATEGLTIIYYTDSSLDAFVERRCREQLVIAAEGKRIISVSQKPIDFGENICVGEIGRSHHSLFFQTLKGAEAVETKYLALAEHDCLYTHEHFNWRPPDDTLFWYNINHWFVQWNSRSRQGEYSYLRRKPMSQLICEREIFIRAIHEKLHMLETGFEIAKGVPGACEPGVCDNREAFRAAKETWDKIHGKVNPLYKDVGKETFSARPFKTNLPNLDIRHGRNFSGGRRARQTATVLPYWGDFKMFMEGEKCLHG